MLDCACLRRRAVRYQPTPVSPLLLLLLLLPLGLGGCWELGTRPRSPALVSSHQERPPGLTEDDLPTPRLFQIDLSAGQSE